MTVLNDAENTVQNTVHSVTESGCKPVQGENQDGDVTPDDFTHLHQFTGDFINRTDNIQWAFLDLNRKSQNLPNKALSKTAKSKRVQNPV